MEINERTIWASRQNHPELVVQDAKESFNLTEEECKRLRFILMNRGVNKWLYARTQFIDLKHEVKDWLRSLEPKTPLHKKVQKLNERMQNIAKTPRWVIWGTHVHKNMKQNEKEIIIKGKPC